MSYQFFKMTAIDLEVYYWLQF